MSGGKTPNLLDGIDLKVLRALQLGMDSGTFLKIEYVYGFEMFGAYETWRGGWRITDPKLNDYRWNRKGRLPLIIEAERIEDAVDRWIAAREECQRIKGSYAG